VIKFRAIFCLIATSQMWALRFTDLTAAAGIHFTHNSGATGKRYLPETMGAGCAFTDIDGDGWADILLINGKDFAPRGRKSTPALYHNNQNGTFSDITSGSGLDIEIYGMGVAVADYDNDGLPDIYITAIEGDHLFHNLGHGKFKDVTLTSGIKNASFGTSAAWFDYDKDGLPDLIVADYATWSTNSDLWCSLDGTSKSYCTADAYKGTASHLFHNLGHGHFADVTQKAGLNNNTSKSLGVLIFDYNGDTWPDIFLANDTQPNKLYRNNGNGTFTEVGLQAGVAYGEDGTARGAMGVDAADYDHSGRPHVLIGNFANQMLGLYHNEGNGFFVDVAPSSLIGRASLFSLTFAAFFFDYDLDGWPDIFAANGHIEPEISKAQPTVQYREPPLMFHNLGGGKFENASNDLGPDFSKPIVARGAAYADFDHDGDLDIVINNNEGPALLYRNDGGNQNNWIAFHLIGEQSNRSALGAVIRIGNQWQTVHSGSSYCSQSDLDLTFGLARTQAWQSVSIEWPSGIKQKFTNLAPNRKVTIDEMKGILQ
jgi:hypothetical protein